MIYNLIIAAAIINIILGVLALVKGRNRLNLSFFILSMLFAAWNTCIVLWQGYGLDVFSRINFLFIDFIPPVSLYFVMSLFGKPEEEEGFTSWLYKFYVLMAVSWAIFTSATFLSPALKDIYFSYACRAIIALYEFVTLAGTLSVIIFRYLKIRFKQERTKVGYVIFAFSILFIGGMSDMTGALKLHSVEYAGNISNVIYAVIIFYAIFRLRLLDAGVVLKNFIVYTFMAVVLAALYTGAALLLANQPKVMTGAFSIISLIAVYYVKSIHTRLALFIQSIGGKSGASEAKKGLNYIRSMQLGEEEKIINTMQLLTKHLEMDAAVYIKQSGYLTMAWAAGNAGFPYMVEGDGGTGALVIRYETKKQEEMELLDVFGASMLAQLNYGNEKLGVLAAKKQTEDISFTQDETDIICEIAAAISFYMKALTLQKKLIEEENMKRIGLMARQMAHEIKNPLTALWGQRSCSKARATWKRTMSPL